MEISKAESKIKTVICDVCKRTVTPSFIFVDGTLRAVMGSHLNDPENQYSGLCSGSKRYIDRALNPEMAAAQKRRFAAEKLDEKGTAKRVHDYDEHRADGDA